METQKAPGSHGDQTAGKSFCRTLREDPAFRRDAKTIGMIAMTALIVNAAMIGLLRSPLDNDPNTHQVIVFTSLVATLVVVSAIICIVNRVVDELFSFIADRMMK